MKILFFASYPTIPIGYGKIGNIISNYMAEQGHTVYYFGISNFGNGTDRYINKNIILIDGLQLEKDNKSDELYGVNTVCDKIQEIGPDIVFLYNDIIVTSRIFNNFHTKKIEKTFKTYVYLDLVYEYEKVTLVDHINRYADKIFVFSDCWKQNLINMRVDPYKINVFLHGFDNNKFYPVDKKIARNKFDFKENDFIVLNTNRNSYRKGIDKTIEGFIIFLKRKMFSQNIKLFLNMQTESSSGYDLLELIKVICVKYNVNYDLIISNHIFKSSYDHFSDEMINYLYNACDIGINTCFGEGFGLCSLEHGGIGKPQIVSGVGALTDIFNNDNAIIVKPVAELYAPNNLDWHGGYLQIANSVDYADALSHYYDNKELMELHGNKLKLMIKEKYNWDKILKEQLLL